ncbi:MAG TPA: hypothetical protein VMV72_00895 [Verrucomicrobiae bacterium]|nr:hypothetical protein [Verrucomicrobiae bacterium]
MAFFSQDFRRLLRHSLESFIYLVLLLIFAVSLTFVEDWLRATHRPAWLITGIQGLAILAFLTDAVGFAGLCMKVLYRALRDIIRQK